jgi:hypothetical protein
VLKEIMLYCGSAIIILWGLAHIAVPTKDIIKGFGPISVDNRRVLAMEWIMEGLALIFIGSLVIFITALQGIENPASTIVYRACSIMLIVMAGVSSFTGARTSIVPMKLCPPIFGLVALLYWFGS